jgi:hypothetical protein
MEREFVFSEAQAMTPLVRRILVDVVDVQRERSRLEREVDLLLDCRKSPRYHLRRQLYAAENSLLQLSQKNDSLVAELEDLGVRLIDAANGVAGFQFNWAPTVGSDKIRKALFLLKLTDEPTTGIRRWRFDGERTEHRVPSHWVDEPKVSVGDEQVL